MSTAIEQLAAQIAALRSQMGKMRGPQLAYSSIENGALSVRDASRTTTGYIGIQDDGTTALAILSGPTPPKPSLPIVAPAIGGLAVTWDGIFPDQPGFISPIAAPWDFLRIEIEVSTDPAFPAVGFGPVAGWITKATGGTAFVPWLTSGQTVYVRFRTRSTSGKLSDPGLTLGPVSSGMIQLGDLGFDIASYAGGTTIYYTVAPNTPTPPSGGFATGDLWLYQTGSATGVSGGPPAGTPLYQTFRWLGAQWALLQDQGISNSLAAAIAAQTSADASAKVFRQSTMPTWTGAANTAVWYDTANGERRNIWNGTTFVPSQLGNGAIQPGSLIASNVIATGSVSAALLEAVMILTTALVAGDIAGQHSTFTSDGFHIYNTIPGEGMVEIGRFAQGAGAFFGLVDADGVPVATISDIGELAAAQVTTDNLIVAGANYEDTVNGLSSGVIGRVSVFLAGNNIGPITTPFGLVEIGEVIETGRAYLVGWQFTWKTDTFNGQEATLRFRYTSSSDVNTQPARPTAATGASGSLATYLMSHTDTAAGAFHTESGQFIVTSTGNARIRLLMQLESTGNTNGITVLNGSADLPIQLYMVDLGPAGVVSGAYQAAGGSIGGVVQGAPSSVKQQYVKTYAPTSFASYDGSGALRTDTTDIVQGYDPSGVHGDGGGYWLFGGLSNINVVPDKVEFYAYTNYSYYPSGATAIWNIITAGGSSWQTHKIVGALAVGGYSRPGGRWITLPQSWWQYFATGAPPIAFGVASGPVGNTNEIYYARFDGPSARLRVTFTQ